MKTSNRSSRSLRRSLSLTAASAMVLAAMPAGFAMAQEADELEPRDTSEVCQEPYDADFDDVDEGNVHADNIHCAADYGITVGYADSNDFGPWDEIRRDQMASFIARWIEDVTDETLPGGDDDAFEDVEADNVHLENINKLAEADIVRGADVDGTTYNPEESVNRGQMTSFISRALSYIDDGDATEDTPPDADQMYFDDVDTDTTHERNINALASVGIAIGYADSNDFGPWDPVERAQMASFVMRAYDYAVASDLLPSPFQATITDIEVDTSARQSPEDFFGEWWDTIDTAPEGAVWPNDQWVLTFSDTMDTGTEGNQVWVEDEDETEYRFECVTSIENALADPMDQEAFDLSEDNYSAACEFDEDGLELTIWILEAPMDEDSDGNGFLSAEYPLEITTTAGFETADGIEGINLADSETTIPNPAPESDNGDDNGNAVT